VAAPIVCGFDGSAGAHAAIKEAVAVARAFNESLVVAFAYGQNPVGGVTGDVKREVEHIGDAFLEEATQIVHELDPALGVEAMDIDAEPVDGLIEIGRERNARMIVIGGNTTGPFWGAIVHAQSYRLINESPIPVLVVQPPDA